MRMHKRSHGLRLVMMTYLLFTIYIKTLLAHGYEIYTSKYNVSEYQCTQSVQQVVLFSLIEWNGRMSRAYTYRFGRLGDLKLVGSNPD